MFAPADPLLIRYAQSWSLSEPYLIRTRNLSAASEAGAADSSSLPLEAMDERAGAVIRMRGPELPQFLRQNA